MKRKEGFAYWRRMVEAKEDMEDEGSMGVWKE